MHRELWKGGKNGSRFFLDHTSNSFLRVLHSLNHCGSARKIFQTTSLSTRVVGSDAGHESLSASLVGPSSALSLSSSSFVSKAPFSRVLVDMHDCKRRMMTTTAAATTAGTTTVTAATLAAGSNGRYESSLSFLSSASSFSSSSVTSSSANIVDVHRRAYSTLSKSLRVYVVAGPAVLFPFPPPPPCS